MDRALVDYAHARLALAKRDPSTALTRAESAGDHLLRCFAIDHLGFVPWRQTAALAAASLGQSERARALAEADLRRAQQCGGARTLGVALHTTALVGDADQQVPLLRQAVATLEQSPSRLALVHALVDLGEALIHRGKRREAQGPLRRALERADHMHADPLATAALHLLHAAGARPRRAAVTGTAALTPTERRVADLAAQGLTNRQIAQALFVTTKTVQTHLSSTYRKLGIDFRTLLPTALHEPAP
jgi:DNA-binding CsgD family transcriptional regulator